MWQDNQEVQPRSTPRSLGWSSSSPIEVEAWPRNELAVRDALGERLKMMEAILGEVGPRLRDVEHRVTSVENRIATLEATAGALVKAEHIVDAPPRGGWGGGCGISHAAPRK